MGRHGMVRMSAATLGAKSVSVPALPLVRGGQGRSAANTLREGMAASLALLLLAALLIAYAVAGGFES